MSKSAMKLTPTEWSLMECLWKHSPRTGREASEYLGEEVGWSRSTTLTLLRRMTKKGFLKCEEVDGVKAYRPLLSKEDATVRETEDFLNRVYRGSISLMVSSMTKKQQLSQAEIDELYQILRKVEGGKK